MSDPGARLARGLAPIPIYTFVNDEPSYAEMRGSFRAAGFEPCHASFLALRVSDGLEHCDPYRAISERITKGTEPFFILCHQDVRADQGHRWSDFLAAVDGLAAIDPGWAVAGNAGGARSLRMVRRITDPYGGSTGHALPALVQTLDENFLVIRTGTGLRCSPGLHGFHFYGSDLCLNARMAGYRAYVIDFHLRHLSAGKKDAAYFEASKRFVDNWSPHFRAKYIRTPMEVTFLGPRVLRRTLGAPRVRRVLKNHTTLGLMAGMIFSRD